MVFNKPHKGLQGGVLVVRRGSKPAENTAYRKKAYLGIEKLLGDMLEPNIQQFRHMLIIQ